ncbi:MAG: twin-arginine translocation protein TatA/E family subunit [Verrucomicrobia bacterium]|nr:twin-arginine translocation protein TatA/E family subunit [Verrucomicrobiota bacterium]
MSPLPSLFALLPSFGGGELVLVLAVVLLLFGGDKMPQLAKGLGKAVREFKKAAGDVEQEFKRALDEVPDNPVKPSPPATQPTVPPPKRLEPPAPPGTSPTP